MPLYEYECESCRKRFERIQKFSDPPVDKCPSCNGAVKKLLSSPAIQFKGTGWYITDYGRKPAADSTKGESGKSDAAKADAPKTDAAGASGESKAESKAASTTPKSD